MRYKHNRNTTFWWSGQLLNHKTGEPVALADYDISSNISSLQFNAVTPLNVSKSDDNTITVTSLEPLEKGFYNWRINLTANNITNSTPPVLLEVTDG